MDSVTIEQTGQALGQLDFSLAALFMRADWVVQLVMIGLILASIISWAVIIEKSRLLRRYRQMADEFEARFWSGESLQTLYQEAESETSNPLANVFIAAMREWERQGEGSSRANEVVAKRVDRAMTNALTSEIDLLEARLPFLATVGSVAPFVGLFGTVWGIMNSFQAIAVTRDTNLAVVAPGIAEALFATGLGLLAAIPAVVAFNMLSAATGKYAQRIDNFVEDFLAFVLGQKGKR